jgi:hypothetical protein
MKEMTQPRQPKYRRKRHSLYRLGALAPGAVALVDILHDTWGGIFTGKRGNGDPDVWLKYSMPGTNHGEEPCR